MDSIDSEPSSIGGDGEVRVAPPPVNNVIHQEYLQYPQYVAYNFYSMPPSSYPSMAAANDQQQYRHQMEQANNFVPPLPTGPVRTPLSYRRLLQRQHAQMARQQRWMAEQQQQQQQQRQQYQHLQYQQFQSPMVNAAMVNESLAAAAAAAAAAYQTAAVAAAAAAATASAFLVPAAIYAAAMPAHTIPHHHLQHQHQQPLILEPSAAITQTTVAGPPFQLIQPQEVAIERVFAPVQVAATLNTIFGRNGTGAGRAAVFVRPPSQQQQQQHGSNTTSTTATTTASYAPYLLVDAPHYIGHYHHQHHHHNHLQQQAHRPPPHHPHWQQQHQQHHHARHQHHHHHHATHWMPFPLRHFVDIMDLPQGVTQQVIDKCTCIHTYRLPEKVPVGEEDKCAVCLAEFESNENVRTLPCSHFFHVECIDRWLACNKKCPVCRLHIDRDLHKTQSTTTTSAAAGSVGIQ